MNYGDQDDVLFGPTDDLFCASPMGGDPTGYIDQYNLAEPLGDDMSGMQFDNSLADVPMDDYQYPADMQSDSRDYQTLQPPVSSGYDMDMGGHSQSSMTGMYTNGGASESMLYEQTTTMSNGDHHMIGGGGEEHYGMPGTSFGSYQPSPLADPQQQPQQHSSPSVSRQQSRPASRTPAQKGGGGGAGGLVHHLNTPSTSSNYSNSPAPLPVKTVPTKKRETHIPPRTSNGSRKKNTQGANTVGAVLTKANKMAATPAATTSSSLRLSAEETLLVAKLTAEIEKLQNENSPHARVRTQEMIDQRAQIFFTALSSQTAVANIVTTPSQPQQPARQPRTQKKQPPPSSPVYTPQCATVYAPDGYAAVPGPSHGGYTATPTAPQSMQQRGAVYKVPSSSGPPLQHGRGMAVGGGGAPPPQAIYMQQQQHNGQPPPQMVQMTSASSSMPSTMTTPVMMGGRRGGGARTMMVRGGPSQQQQPLPVQQLQQLQHVPPGTTVRAALKQGGLQHLQQQHHHHPNNNNNHHQLQQQQPQQGPLQHHMQQQQQHRASPMMPSTSQQQQQPQPLLQLSLPVHQQQQLQQQQQLLQQQNTPYRPNPQLTLRRIEDKKQGRQRKLQTAFDIMSQQLLQPETEVPFAGVDDVFRRLMPYHLLFEHDMDPQLEEEFDMQFMRSMVETDEKKKRLTDRMRSIAITEAVARKDEECNLLLFLDAEYERNRLEEEKKMSRETVIPIARCTALALASSSSSALPAPSPSAQLTELKSRVPEGLVPLSQSFYEYHPFVERRRLPTPPPPGPLHGLEESEVEDDTEDEKEESAAAAAGTSSAEAAAPTIKRSASASTEDEASPEMGWPADDLAHTVSRPTVPRRPATVLSSSMHKRPATAAVGAGKVQPPIKKEIKQEVASPARNSRVTVAGKSATVPSKHEMPEAIPVPLALRNRMVEDRMREEERRKKEDERSASLAEERRRKEDERKERERRKKEEERARVEEKRRIEEERIAREERERKEREEREEKERRKKEEEQKNVIMPLKIKFKITAREEKEEVEEVKKEEEEEENREKKSKKKRKKEKRRAEDDEEYEREKKRRKKEKKAAAAAAESAASAAAVATPAAAAATTMTTPVVPKLKIKFGGGATPAATPAAAAAAATTTTTLRPPMQPAAASTPTPFVPAAAPATPQLQPVQPAPPLSVPRLKIKLGGVPAVAAAAAAQQPEATPSPRKEEKRREEREEKREDKEERRKKRDKDDKKKENGHHEEREERKEKEKHHRKHKEHKSERRHHREHQSQSQPVAAAQQPTRQAAAAASQPVVPSVKITVAPPRSQPAAAPSVQPMQQPQQQQMAMNSHKSPLQLFRPSVIAAPPSLPLQQVLAAAAAGAATLPLGLPQQLQQQPLLPAPVLPAVAPLILGLARLPPGPEEKSPERVVFSDSEDEDEKRSNSLHQSAAAITRMVGHAPTLLPQHHHRLPQMQPAFPWNNQFQ